MEFSATQEQIDGAIAYENILVPALFEDWVPRVADASGVGPGLKALDIACGTGCLTREVAKRAGPTGAVTGLDLNPGMLAIASRHPTIIEWALGAAESLPFEDESFDVTLSQFGINFFEDHTQALFEMRRVLRWGGQLTIAVWDTLDSMPAYVAEVGLLE